MTEEQWLTNRQMALLSVDAVQRLGPGNVARYPLIDITNAVISRMLLGGPGPDGSDPHFRTQGAIFYEVRSVGQKSNGMLEQLFVRPTMAVLAAAADGACTRIPARGGRTSPSGKASPAEEGLPSNERWRAAAKPMASGSSWPPSAGSTSVRWDLRLRAGATRLAAADLLKPGWSGYGAGPPVAAKVRAAPRRPGHGMTLGGEARW